MAKRSGESRAESRLTDGLDTIGSESTNGEDGGLTEDRDGTPGDQREIDGAAIDAGDSVDPASLGGNDSAAGSGGSGKRRGRKPGSRNKSGGSGKPATKTTDSIATMLYSVHMMGSMLLKTPEMMLSEVESSQLAKAIKDVSELYDVPFMDEKTLAWFNLAMVAGKVYGPRVIAAVNNNKKKPVEVKQAPVMQMPNFQGVQGVM